jgi:tetratricopeptide (TPR) repeat protein
MAGKFGSHISRFFGAALICAALGAAGGGLPARADEPCGETPASVTASKLYTDGKSEDALPYAEQALDQAEKICGAKNADLLVLLADLAAIHQSLKQYDQAEIYLRRVIDIKQAALAPEESGRPGLGLSNMIFDLDNLAFVYGAQGKFGEAGKLFERALAIAENAVGGDHIIVAQALRNLAQNYRAEGRFADADPLLSRAAAIEAGESDEMPSDWAAKLGVVPQEPLISVEPDAPEASLHPRDTARR